MSTKANNPAFPSDEYPGMLMREWLAGMSLPVVAAIIGEVAKSGVLSKRNIGQDVAAMAFEIADAMLAKAVQS